MIRLLFLIILFSHLCFQCKAKQEDKKISLNSYTSALDVPLRNTGVVISIDSVTFFKQENMNKDDISNKVLQSIHSINKNFDLETVITNKVKSILNEKNIKYSIIEEINQDDFPNELITKKNINTVDFKSIKEKHKVDDLIILNIKNGFDYKHDDPKNNKNFVAKTFLELNILDLNEEKLKFAENIGGVRFLDEPIDSINQKHLENIMGKSINETIEIIAKKY